MAVSDVASSLILLDTNRKVSHNALRVLHYRALVLLICAIVLGLGSSRTVRAQPSIIVAQEFDSLQQGTVGILRISGEEIVGGNASIFDRAYPFFPTTEGFASLVAVPMDQKVREYPIVTTIYLKDGSSVQWDGNLNVSPGGFIAEPDFTIPPDKAKLLNPDIEVAEETRLQAIYSVLTPERYWEGPFVQPVDGKLTSPFGSVRTFTNDGEVRRHSGYDLKTTSGLSIVASASGRVVYAQPLDIHGNNIVVDHGWGVFSEYAHLSAIYVVPGQFMLQGEIIGASGNTGRSTGSHLHWEIAVNGIRVDPAQFLRLRLPL
ncbi:MAG: M23 family metallopeptidase [Anaerolineae bacterium]|nr:M23 family metallopeptidase [Anaerolineae bacterium]